eukprot:1160000-Pelagomonas_calceolata.AAC.20
MLLVEASPVEHERRAARCWVWILQHDTDALQQAGVAGLLEPTLLQSLLRSTITKRGEGGRMRYTMLELHAGLF